MSKAPGEFKFLVNPRESPEDRDLRWDKWMDELRTDGLTIQGVGPDGDYPIRYSYVASGDEEIDFEEWFKGNPDAIFFEVYSVVPLKVGTPADLKELAYV